MFGLPTDVRPVSDAEFWREMTTRWQQWADALLTELGLQLEGGSWGDEPAREMIRKAVVK